VTATDESVGGRLKEFRGRTGLGLRTFAVELEARSGTRVSYGTIRSWEEGRSQPPAWYLLEIARAFPGLGEPEWLLTGRSVGEPGEAETHLRLVAGKVGELAERVEELRRFTEGYGAEALYRSAVEADTAARKAIPPHQSPHRETAER
jgi:transcriptional regulator with XRE-family HTH domain